jgi:hypothetical protein
VKRPTSALRIALAVLAAAFLSSLVFVVVTMSLAFAEGVGGSSGPVRFIDLLSSASIMWTLTFLVGGPLTLGLMLFPLSPLWFLHHQAGGGPISFLAGGAATGLVLGLALIGFTTGTPSGDAVLTVAAFTLTALTTTAAIWRIAYGPFSGSKQRRLSTAPAQQTA